MATFSASSSSSILSSLPPPPSFSGSMPATEEKKNDPDEDDIFLASLDVGQLIFAKVVDTKSWAVAKIINIHPTKNFIDIQYLDSSISSSSVAAPLPSPSPSPSRSSKSSKTSSSSSSSSSSEGPLTTIPLHKDFIQSVDRKRKRKFRINFDEEERLLNTAIGINKKMKNKPTTESPSTTDKKSNKTTNKNGTVDENGMELLNGDDVEQSGGNSHRLPSKNIQNVKINEAATESSLQEHLSVLKPFITTKIYEKIQNSPASTATHHSITTQPKMIKKAILRDYQISGVSWLVNQYLKSINSILADEMGLGKTLQTISYISYLTTELNLPGPHLIVVPLSVLFNWILEFRTFCPSLRIVRMHSNSSQDQQRLRDILTNMARFTSADSDASSSSTSSSSKGSNTCPYDVVITTYEMVKGKLESNLKRVYWRTMVLDEGHRIKNDDTLITKACLHYKTRFKIILTGTPIQNNLHETFTILHFLHPNIFQTSETFDTAFQFHGSDIHVNQHLVDRTHYLLRVFLLRRIKTEVEQKLPPKLETVVKCPMSPMQIFWSKRLLLRESDLIEKLEENMSSEGIKSNGNGNAWKRLHSLLAQLRKAANHPYLFPDAEDLSNNEDLSATEEIVTASGKMMMLDRLLPHLQANKHRVVLFSQYTRTLDIIQDYLEMRGYRFTRLDGSTHRVNREVRITQFNRAGSQTFIFLLSTRAGGEGVNLYTADTVILFDSDWNPQVDIQAMARVHRIGQTKTVHIYRFVTSGTVEERIVQRAQKKLYLDSLVNRGCTSQALELDKLRAGNPNKSNEDAGDEVGTNDEDISTMMSALKFGFGAVFSRDATTEKQVTLENIITDEEIHALIDRTRGLKPNHLLEEAPPTMKRAKSLPNNQKTNGRRPPSTPQMIRGRSDGLNSIEEIDISQEDEQLPSAAPTLSHATSLTENQEESVASFQRNLTAPLVDVRYLNGEYHSRTVSTERAHPESLIIKNTRPIEINGSSSNSNGNGTHHNGSSSSSRRRSNNRNGEMVDLTEETEISLLQSSSTTSSGPSSEGKMNHDGSKEDDFQNKEESVGPADATVVAADPAEEKEEEEGEEEDDKTPNGKKSKSRKSEGRNLKSIASDWAREKANLAVNQRSIRQKQVRTEIMNVEGVGRVQVLKVNKYSLEDGEPSVFEREMKGKTANWSDSGRKGKSFQHQGICQQCWAGGSLVCCNYCPASYHPKCLGLKGIPRGIWVCPHHAGCITCSKPNTAMGFTFRCEACPNAYCEDCLPTTAEILEGCARWQALGYDIPGNCCFIQCSTECSTWMAATPKI